MAFTCAYSGHQ